MKTRQNKLRKPKRDKEVVPEASVGGILASTAIGAGTGAIGGGGVLSAPGAIIGGAVGLATGLWDHFKEKKQEKTEAKANLALGMASGGVQAGAGGSFNNYTDMWAARNGGVVPNGNMPVQDTTRIDPNSFSYNHKKAIKDFKIDSLVNDIVDRSKDYETATTRIQQLLNSTIVTGTPEQKMPVYNYYLDKWKTSSRNKSPEMENGGIVTEGTRVSVEKKEVSMDPEDGSMKTFNEEPHPNNNVTNFKPGTIIFSDNPALTMPNGLTPAKNADKLKLAKGPSMKVLDNPNASVLAKRTAERNVANIDKQLGKILGFQVEMTQKLGAENKITAGSVEEATWGEIIKATGTFLKSDTGKQVVNTAVQLAPTAYNAIKGRQKVEQLDPSSFQNPMAYGALDSMRNRTYNMTPALQATDDMYSSANANLRSTSTGRGQYGANTTALANAAMKQKAGIYAQGSQMQNQYLGEYGQMQGALGQKMADTNLLISDLNARNQAAGRNYGAAAAGQISQWGQIQQQMAGQKANSAMLMEAYRGFAEMMGLPNTAGPTDANVGFDMTDSQKKYKMTHPNG